MRCDSVARVKEKHTGYRLALGPVDGGEEWNDRAGEHDVEGDDEKQAGLVGHRHRDRNRENRPEDGGDCGMHDTVRRNNACTVRGGAGFGEREGCAQRLEVRQCGA